MSLKCKIGLHIWDGCKCSVCGKIRDEQHDWSKNCEECSKCGKTISSQHDYSNNCCVCSKCDYYNGKVHNYSENCEYCSECGMHNISPSHNWENCICKTCGKELDYKSFKGDPISLLKSNRNSIKNFIKKYPAALEYTSEFSCYHTFQLLHIAAVEGFSEAIDVLIESGANVNAITQNNINGFRGYTALHLAVINANVDGTERLLQNKANPNISVIFGDRLATPLHLAIRWNDKQVTDKQMTTIAKLLIDNGTNLTENNGQTFISYARIYKRNKILALLPKIELTYKYIEGYCELIKSTHEEWTGKVSIFYGKSGSDSEKPDIEFSVEGATWLKDKSKFPELLPIKYEDDGFPSFITIQYKGFWEKSSQTIELISLNNDMENIFESKPTSRTTDVFKTYIKTISEKY